MSEIEQLELRVKSALFREEIDTALKDFLASPAGMRLSPEARTNLSFAALRKMRALPELESSGAALGGGTRVRWLDRMRLKPSAAGVRR